MTEPAAPPVAVEAPAPAAAETATTPSVAGGAELGSGVKGRPAAIERARVAMQERDSASRDQALKQATEHAEKTRAKVERDKAAAPERDESGKFKPALSPADATKQAKELPTAKPGELAKPAPLEDDDAKLDAEWRKVRSAKKTAREERQQAQAWREEQARTKSEAEADSKLRKENPAKWLEKHEFDFREVAKQSVAKVEPTPAEKAANAALEKAERLEKQLQERDARDAEVSRQRALAEVNREHAAAWADSGADYPTLSAHYEPAEIIETLTELRVAEYKRSGREVPISAALSHMEKLARQEQARFTKVAPAAKERTERATVAPKGAKTRAVVGPVTNRDAAVTATPPTGISPEERRARSTQLAAQGWRR